MMAIKSDSMTLSDLINLPGVRQLPVISLPDGQLLFDETRSCLGFPLVSRGRVKVFKSFQNGRELLLYQVAPGETCVVSAACLFSGQPYTACAVSQEDLEIRVIPPVTTKAQPALRQIQLTKRPARVRRATRC
jgi:CRP-like cAMP-binding protein